MRLSELLKDVAVISCTVPMETEIPDITNDSRNVTRGGLFAAIRGSRTDGNQYIHNAVQKGAAAVLTAVPQERTVPYILVEQEDLAWAKICRNYYGRPDEKLTLIGVTGTNGKTSVTMLLKQLLEQVRGEKVGLIGTTGTYIGREWLPSERTTPDAQGLQRLLGRMVAQGCRYAVMEVSSHALARERVGGMVFDGAAFTNLTEDHLDFHTDMQDYAYAKAKLFSRARYAVVNADDPWAKLMVEKAGCPVLWVGCENEVDLNADRILLNERSVSFAARCGREEAKVRVPIPGLFTVSNALVTLGLAMGMGISLHDGAKALEKVRGIPGRMEPVPTPGKPYSVIIDYAHTPDALEKLLKSIREFCRGRIILVVGCGGDRDKGKRPLMGAIGATLADYVIFTSDNPRSEDPLEIIRQMCAGVKNGMENATILENRRKAIRYAMDIGEKNDIIILAGKGHETTQEIKGVRHHLDERAIVRAYLTETEDRYGNHHTEAGGRLVRRKDRSEICGSDLPGGLQ